MSAKLHIGYMKKTCICLTVAEMKYNHVLHMCNTLVIHDTITLAIIHKITLTQLTDCIIVIVSCNSHLFQFK